MQTPPGAALVQVLPRDGLSVAADVAIIVVAVAVVVLAAVTAHLLLKAGRAIGEIRLGVRQNLGPVSDRARAISDNVEFITQALRADVERLNASVKSLTDRLQLASDRMEERIEEFNALMEVVQDEAEDIFIDTASTVRGVREGARAMTLRRGAAASQESGPPEETEPGDTDGDEAEALATEEV
jgi:hypothetical protein